MPGSAGSAETPVLSMMRMPTVPLVAAQSAIVSATAGSVGSTGLTSLKRLGMRRVDLYRVAGVVAIHGERRDQHRAVDADRIHRGHHVVAGDLGRTVENADPRPARMVAFIGVHLGIDVGMTSNPSRCLILARAAG